MGYKIMPAVLRLMRVHQPAGVLLLFWPAAWSLMLHSPTIPWKELGLFFLGAFLMRSFGCIINDITDRKFDVAVSRTANRPLASGEISIKEAIALAALLLLSSACIACFLGLPVVAWSSAVLPLVVLYPWMKRITYWPQVFLGLTFSWGALLASVAMNGSITVSAVLIYTAAVFWTLGYDTIYAYQDIEDDAKIGVKSSARALGHSPRMFLSACYFLCIFLLFGSGLMLGLAPFGAMLVYQIVRLDTASPQRCLQLFKLNAWLGFLPMIALLL